MADGSARRNWLDESFLIKNTTNYNTQRTQSLLFRYVTDNDHFISITFIINSNEIFFSNVVESLCIETKKKDDKYLILNGE